MRIHLLVEDNMLPIPSTLNVIQNYGFLEVVNHETHKRSQGDHVLLEGSQEAIEEWLKGYTVWMGQGSPIQQSFSLIEFAVTS